MSGSSRPKPDRPGPVLPWPGLGPAPVLDDFTEQLATSGATNLTHRSIRELETVMEVKQKIMEQSIQATIDAQIAQRGRIDELITLGQIKLEEAAEMYQLVDQYVETANSALVQVKGASSEISSLSKDLMRNLGNGTNMAGGGSSSEEVKKSMDAIKEQQKEISRLVDEQEQSLQKYNDVLSKVSEVDKTFEEAGEALRKAREAGEDITELQEEFDNAFQAASEARSAIGEAETAYKASKILNKLKLDKAVKFIKKMNAVLEAGTEYDKGWKITNFLIKRSASTIDEYVKPIRDFAKNVKRINKFVQEGYEAYADSLIESGDAEKYLKDIAELLDKEVDMEKESVKKQLRIINDIMESEGTGDEMSAAITEEASKWLSPSWRTITAMDEDLVRFGEEMKFGNVIDYLFTFGKGVAVLTKTLVRIPLIAAYSGLEAAVGVRSAVAITETIGSILGLVGELGDVIIAPSTQAAIMSFYGFVDAFRVHNFGSWEYDMMWLVTAGLSTNIDWIKIMQYDKFSSKGTGQMEDPSKMWEIDHKELKTVLDFWGDVYLKELSRITHDKKVYQPYADFGGIIRRPGLYIDPNNHPFESDEIISQCIEIENSLDVGTLVDESGLISGADPLGNTTSNLFPKMKGLVRNLVAFPLYKNTVTWPDRNGSFIQTKGNFTPDSLDPNIVNLWTKWVESGEWGIMYNSPNATDETRAAAIKTNMEDYQSYMHPTLNDKFIATKIKKWVDNNKGKKQVLQQKMHGVTLAVLEKERVTDYPDKVEKGFFRNLIPAKDVLAFQDTLDFVETVFAETGRYPITPKARSFYSNVIQKGKTKHVVWQSVGSFENKIQFVEERNATNLEVQKYARVVEQLDRYMQALARTQATTDSAWDETWRISLFEAYVKDTSPRTTWGYIQENQQLLITELQSTTNIMLGSREVKVWTDYMKAVSKAGIPLNTNRYARLSLVGKMNQLVYSTRAERLGDIEKQIEKVGGKILVNKLITTGLNTEELDSWARAFRNSAILITGAMKDFPVYFGNLHCRIIVIEKPKPTCFVIFRGTTNFWEWVIDLDFSGAEYGSLKKGKRVGTFELDITESSETVTKDFKSVIYGDPDMFAVHRGFLRCWKVFKPKVESTLDTIYKQYDIQDVILSGHSLGAGITQIACLDLPSLPRKRQVSSNLSLGKLGGLVPLPGVEYMRPHAYMFSSPCVGDQRFAWHFASQAGESAHAYIDGDLITMIPPFLLPAKESWGEAANVAILNDIRKIAEEDGGVTATLWVIVKRVFNELQTPFNPYAWQKDGKLDWSKIASSGVELAGAYAKHRAFRGGGVFLRLDRDQSGTFEETADDPGSSSGSFESISKVVFDQKELVNRHSIDHVVSTLDKVVQANPDLFEAIDKNENPQWGDAGSSPRGEQPILPIDPPKGKIVALATSTKRYKVGQYVPKEHIDPTTIVLLPDIDEINRRSLRQRNRRKKRKIMEGEYHGY